MVSIDFVMRTFPVLKFQLKAENVVKLVMSDVHVCVYQHTGAVAGWAAPRATVRIGGKKKGKVTATKKKNAKWILIDHIKM